MSENANKYFQRKNFTFNVYLKDVDADKLLFQTSGKTRETLVLPVTDGTSEMRLEVFTFGQADSCYATIDGEWTTIDWANRNNKEIVSKVAYNKKYAINLGRKEEYIHEYDFIRSLHEHMKNGDMTSKLLKITGDLEYSLRNKEPQLKLKPRFVGLAPEGDVPYMKALVSTLFTKDAVVHDVANKTLTVNGFVQEYVKLEGESGKSPRMFPQEFKIDYAKNPKTEVALEGFYKNVLSVDDNYKAIYFECDLFKAADEVKVGELTEEQKLYISLGLLSEEQAIIDNTVKDNKETFEFRVVAPNIKKEPYTKTTFIPDEQDKFVFGFEPKVTQMFDTAPDTSLLFETSAVSDSDLDSFFS